MTNQEIFALSDSFFEASMDEGLPEAERIAAGEAFKAIRDEAFKAAMGDFRKGTSRFVDLSQKFAGVLADIPKPGASLRKALEKLGAAHAATHDAEGMRTTWQTRPEFEEVFPDEQEIAPGGVLAALPGAPVGVTQVGRPVPVNSRSYADLADEYVAFFAAAGWKNDTARREAQRFAETAEANRARYGQIETRLGIPWWFVAGVHLLESTYNFATHLHNGDLLTHRTHRVPAGRPEAGDPPFTWEESALDALTGEGLAGLADWSLARALYRWEAYNGFGYRKRGVPTPYLWSGTTIYEKGKFVGDGVFSANAVSKQCGAAALLKALMERAAVDAPRVEVLTEGAEHEALEPDAPAAPTAPPAVPVAPQAVPPAHPFALFVESQIPGLRHFRWDEFLVKGASHATNGLNSDPPPEKWRNVIPLARVLDEFRERIGAGVRLHSVYRNVEYNRSVGGKPASQHLQFCAADFSVPGTGGPADWARLLRTMRDEGFFSGGIGTYSTFVHVDTRGTNPNWNGE